MVGDGVNDVLALKDAEGRVEYVRLKCFYIRSFHYDKL